MKQLLVDERTIPDLRSEREQRSTEQPYVELGHQESVRRSSIPHRTVIFKCRTDLSIAQKVGVQKTSGAD